MSFLKTLQEVAFVGANLQTLRPMGESLVFVLEKLIKVFSSGLTSNIQSCKQTTVSLSCLQLQVLAPLGRLF